MPEPRRHMATRVFASTLSGITPDQESARKPYQYRGVDTQPDPREIAAKVRAEVARRREGGNG